MPYYTLAYAQAYLPSGTLLTRTSITLALFRHSLYSLHTPIYFFRHLAPAHGRIHHISCLLRIYYRALYFFRRTSDIDVKFVGVKLPIPN
jgi:hypothetical protein